MKRTIAIVFTILSALLIIDAQPLDLDFSPLGNEFALSSSNATCITQDTLGYIWIGTADGLNRFDGYEMKVYRVQNDDTHSLPDNSIRCLYTDSRGVVWIGTNSALCTYIPEYDCFRSYDLSRAMPEYEAYQIQEIFENKKNEILIAAGDQLIRYSCAKDSVYSFLTLENGDISSLAIDSTGNIWIGTLGEGGLYNVDPQGTILQRYYTGDKGTTHINSNMIFDLAIFKDNLWIATEGGGINALDLKTHTFRQYPTFNFYERYARFTYVDNDGNLWTGDHTGLKIYNESEDVFIGYYTDPNDPFSVPSNAVAIFQDFQGNYWTLHMPGGIAISEAKKGFKTFSGNPLDYWHTSRDNIASIEEDYMGNLWLSNTYNGIDVF
ncbi:MAG: two-component regulator propeller domain-containing protein [Anaerolineales bacterium]